MASLTGRPLALPGARPFYTHLARYGLVGHLQSTSQTLLHVSRKSVGYRDGLLLRDGNASKDPSEPIARYRPQGWSDR